MTATNLQGHIKSALQTRVVIMGAALSLPVAYWDDADFTKPLSSGKPLPFVEAKVFSAPTADLHVDLSEASLTGFLQLNLNWPQNAGEVQPANTASKIINYFRRGLKMYSSPVIVQLLKTPSSATPFLLSPYTITQITIPYQVFSRQF